MSWIKILSLIFITLKLVGELDWGWGYVLIPCYIIVLERIVEGIIDRRNEGKSMMAWKSEKHKRIPVKVLVPSIMLFGKTEHEDIARRNLFLEAEKLGARISMDQDEKCVVFNFESEQNARHFVDIAKRTIIFGAKMEEANE